MCKMWKRNNQYSIRYSQYTFYTDLREQIIELEDLSLKDITEEDLLKYKGSKEALSKAREDKALSVVSMLELFQGQLSLDDILYTEIPILNQLHDAKIKYMKEVAKAREQKR